MLNSDARAMPEASDTAEAYRPTVSEPVRVAPCRTVMAALDPLSISLTGRAARPWTSSASGATRKVLLSRLTPRISENVRSSAWAIM